MAKKREWKAWMVVNKRGELWRLNYGPFYGFHTFKSRAEARDFADLDGRVIRVRITEEK